MFRIPSFSFILATCCALAGCGGSDEPSAGGGSATSATLAAEPAAAPAASEAAQVSRSAASTADLSTFDFARGTRLPEPAVLSVGDAWFRPGANVAHVPVTLDKPTPNTVIARLITVNGSGADRAIGNYQFAPVDTVVIFRPGDPLRRTVEIPILSARDGQSFAVKLREPPWGGTQGTASGAVTASLTHAPTPPATGVFREPRRFAAAGRLQFDMSRTSMKWGPTGGPNTWSTQLSHGRTQPANGETGLYVDWGFAGIEAPLRYTDGGLIFHTQKFKQPIRYQGADHHYGAVVLSAHNFPTAQIGYGQYEWVARMPDRRGSWPALWLISTSGWPPEIDIYEGFGFEDYWDFDRHIAATLHGGSNGTRSFMRGVGIQAEQAYGISGLSKDFHSYAVDIQPDYITWFVDGRETYQSVNPFRGFRWYPIMNVAVKTNGAYDDGSGDMIVKRLRIHSND